MQFGDTADSKSALQEFVSSRDDFGQFSYSVCYFAVCGNTRRLRTLRKFVVRPKVVSGKFEFAVQENELVIPSLRSAVTF